MKPFFLFIDLNRFKVICFKAMPSLISQQWQERTSGFFSSSGLDSFYTN